MNASATGSVCAMTKRVVTTPEPTSVPATAAAMTARVAMGAVSWQHGFAAFQHAAQTEPGDGVEQGIVLETL